MFTGIITDVGRVKNVNGDADKTFSFETSYNMASVEIGASIACNGVCLTVVDKGEGWFSADVSAETIKVTSAGDWQEGSEINFERSLKVGDELGGHIVTGHVDCLGKIVVFQKAGDSIALHISIPVSFRHLVASKGSVAINGVSLTVNDVEDRDKETIFTINLIPHTQSVTSFRASKQGDAVNVEFDVLARYVSRLQHKR